MRPNHSTAHGDPRRMLGTMPMNSLEILQEAFPSGELFYHFSSSCVRVCMLHALSRSLDGWQGPTRT